MSDVLKLKLNIINLLDFESDKYIKICPKQEFVSVPPFTSSHPSIFHYH